jgi:hypothetical protein
VFLPLFQYLTTSLPEEKDGTGGYRVFPGDFVAPYIWNP